MYCSVSQEAAYAIFKFCVIQVKQREKFLGTCEDSLWKHSMQLKAADL